MKHKLFGNSVLLLGDHKSLVKSPLIWVTLLGLWSSANMQGCARAPLQEQKQSMRRVTPPSHIQDDLPLDSLFKAIETEVKYLEALPAPLEFNFGEEHFSQAEYLNSLRNVVELGKASTRPESFYEGIKSEFDFYEVYGQESWGEVFITSYFEPIIKGSLRKTESFSTPLYKTPKDIISLDLALFDKKYETDRKLRGRLFNGSILPYYNREDIDSKFALQGKDLEICWVDPLDAFILQIQGSGTVDLGDGRLLFVNYAEKNGQPYQSVGKFLKEFIPKEELTLYSIEKYLRRLSKDEMQSYLNKNPSYVFFQTSKQHAITSLGVPSTEGRTIATDPRFFPKGALALLRFNKPIFSNEDSPLPASVEEVSRLVLDQDIGGAIQGGGRVDLFWGAGEQSKRYSGVMKARGALYYLVPKRTAQAR